MVNAGFTKRHPPAHGQRCVNNGGNCIVIHAKQTHTRTLDEPEPTITFFSNPVEPNLVASSMVGK